MFFFARQIYFVLWWRIDNYFPWQWGDFTNENKRFIQVMCGDDGV